MRQSRLSAVEPSLKIARGNKLVIRSHPGLEIPGKGVVGKLLCLQFEGLCLQFAIPMSEKSKDRKYKKPVFPAQ